MQRSTRSFLFPDVNVWIALTYRGHIHYNAARIWLDSVPDDSELCFCRLTQVGFLRLLTTPAVMGNRVMSQAAAWEVYDDWLENGRAGFIEEPPSIERIFRALSQSRQPAPKTGPIPTFPPSRKIPAFDWLPLTKPYRGGRADRFC